MMNPQLVTQLRQSLVRLQAELGDLRLTELERARIHTAFHGHERLVGTLMDVANQPPRPDDDTTKAT